MSHDDFGQEKISAASVSDPDVPSIFQSEKDVLSLLGQIRRIPNIKKKTIRSLDFDMLNLNAVGGVELKKAYMHLRHCCLRSMTLDAECDLIEAMYHKVLTRQGKGKDSTISALPKKPVTAFMLFGKKCWKKLKAKNPGIHPSQRMKLISEKWKNLSDDKKQKYKALAETEHESYKKVMKAFLVENPVEPKIKTSTFIGTGFDLFFALNKRRLEVERGSTVRLRDAALRIYLQMDDDERRSFDLKAKRLSDSNLTKKKMANGQPKHVNSEDNDATTSGKSKNRTISASSHSSTSFVAQPSPKKLKPSAVLQNTPVASKADRDSDDSLLETDATKPKNLKVHPAAKTSTKAAASSKRKKSAADVSSSSESDSDSDTSAAVKKPTQTPTKNKQVVAAAASTDSGSDSDTVKTPAAAVKIPAQPASKQGNPTAASSSDSDTSSTVKLPATTAIVKPATKQAVKPIKAVTASSDSDSSSADAKTPAAAKIVRQPPPNIIAPTPKSAQPPAVAAVSVVSSSSTDDDSGSDAPADKKLMPAQVGAKLLTSLLLPSGSTKPERQTSPQKDAKMSPAAQHSRPAGHSPKKVSVLPNPRQMPSTPVVVASHKRRKSSSSSSSSSFMAKDQPQAPIAAHPTHQRSAHGLKTSSKPKKRKK